MKGQKCMDVPLHRGVPRRGEGPYTDKEALAAWRQIEMSSEVKAWREAVDVAFADHAGMVSFPEPPATGECGNKACVQDGRLLKACGCQIARAFFETGVDLKKDRLRWHPDKFNWHAERDEMVAKADAVSKVVNRLYELEK